MRVLSVPFRLKLAVATLYLSVLFIAIEVMIVTRAPWWKLPYRNIGYWSLTYAVVCVLATTWIFKAKRWAYSFVVTFACLWILMSTLTFIRMKYPPVGFFTLFLMGFLSVELFWIKYEMDRSFFDPQLAWYQGLPQSIPGLQCHVTSGDKTLDLKVGRFDHDGAFIFSRLTPKSIGSDLSMVLGEEKLDMIFRFREHQIACQGVPILAMDKGIGAGIQFSETSGDQKKEIGDFVELLRGEGYV